MGHFSLFDLWAAVNPWGLMLLGMAIMCFNWRTLLREYKLVNVPPGTPYMSPVPIFGGAIVGIGLAQCSVPELRGWWWLPTLLDPGGLMPLWFEAVVRVIRWLRRLGRK